MHFKDVESKIHRGEMTYSKVIQLLLQQNWQENAGLQALLG